MALGAAWIIAELWSLVPAPADNGMPILGRVVQRSSCGRCLRGRQWYVDLAGSARREGVGAGTMAGRGAGS